jgi:diaminopimelate decarboxylase
VGDLLAIHLAGAYGFSMASHYNLHILPREILITGGKAKDISFNPRDYTR